MKTNLKLLAKEAIRTAKNLGMSENNGYLGQSQRDDYKKWAEKAKQLLFEEIEAVEKLLENKD